MSTKLALPKWFGKVKGPITTPKQIKARQRASIKRSQDKHIRDGHRMMRLKRLAEIASTNHLKSAKSWRRALNYAKTAGDALCQARRLHRKRGTWQPWLKENFEGSNETARIYMRIARRWDEPEIKEARASGTITSLTTFLAFTRKAQHQQAIIEALGPEALIPTEADDLRKGLVQLFKARLRMLDIDKLRILDDWFGGIWGAALRELKRYQAFDADHASPVEVDMTEAEEQAAIALEEKAFERIYRKWKPKMVG